MFAFLIFSKRRCLKIECFVASFDIWVSGQQMIYVQYLNWIYCSFKIYSYTQLDDISLFLILIYIEYSNFCACFCNYLMLLFRSKFAVEHRKIFIDKNESFSVEQNKRNFECSLISKCISNSLRFLLTLDRKKNVLRWLLVVELPMIFPFLFITYIIFSVCFDAVKEKDVLFYKNGLLSCFEGMY